MRLGILTIVALVLLCACGVTAPTVTPTSVPTATLPPAPTVVPTPTLAPAQLTAQAIRANQQAGQQATVIAKQGPACAKIDADYAKVGRTFDRLQARRDPELAFIDLRIVQGGTGQPPLNRYARLRDDLERQTLWACLGLPEPPITPLT